MNKKLIKQISFIVVCAVLIISAFFLSLDFDEVAAGAGKGTNAKIETINNVSALIGGFNRQLSGYNAPSEKESAEGEYKSFTLYQTSKAKYKDSLEALSFRREMTLYATENASYYVSDCTVESESAIIKAFLNFKISLYIENGFILLRFDKYDALYAVKADEENNDIDFGLADSNIYKILGKWLYISADEKSEYGEIVSLLNSINSSNFEVFEVIGNYLRDESMFKKDGKEYYLLEEFNKRFIDDLLEAQFGYSGYSDETSKASFKVDLSNKTEPQLKLSVDSSYSNKNYSDGNLIAYSCSSIDVLTFKNINNTFIKAPSTNNALSFEEFVAIVEG